MDRSSSPAADAAPHGSRPLAAALNRACECFSVSRDSLVAAVGAAGTDMPDLGTLAGQHAHLIAGSPVFVSDADAQGIAQFARDLESVVALPDYAEDALAQAGQPPGASTPGGMLGLDFHLTATGPQLIEINTNPGGALINVEILRALGACCHDAAQWLPPVPDAATVRDRIFDVFRHEWQAHAGTRAGRGAPVVAIVDEKPRAQYLYPEFLLYRALFESHGWQAVIADPSELTTHNGTLRAGDRVVDVVYNRLTDFPLGHAAHAHVLRAARDGSALVTPHPRAHALYADKRLLAWLSNGQRLQEMGASPEVAARVAARVPPTFRVERAETEHWWARRKDYFFKPAAGYGGKAAYDGAKLTRRVWAEIVQGDYLAQHRVPPPQRGIHPDRTLKYDLRAYAYRGEVLLLAARLYRGQTTNFRSPGGGFAPVVIVSGATPTAPPCMQAAG